MTVVNEQQEFLSTSRLAKLLAVDGKALFQLLSDKQWIVHVDDRWQLTAQGEYHGGRLQHSDKYGDYIVWPISLADHPVLQELDGLMISVSKIAEAHDLSAQSINLLLSHLGWIEKDQRGWMLTDIGMKQGGEVRSSKNGFYVMWPAKIRSHTLFEPALAALSAENVGCSLDGHRCHNAAEQRLCNWFYLHGLAHAYQHMLPGQDFLKADFYLPQRKVYIDFWDVNASQLPLSIKLQRQDYYQQHGLKHIELSRDDLSKLDDVLPQKLLQYGVQLY